MRRKGRPYTDRPLSARSGLPVSWGRFVRLPRRSSDGILRFDVRGQHGVRRWFVSFLCAPIGTRFVLLQGVVSVMRKSAVRDSPVSGIAQHSWSNLEVCGSIYRCHGAFPRRVGAQICAISRSTIVVDGGSPGGVYEPGDACVAPTQIYRTHRAWTLPLVPVSFLCGASSS